MNDKIHEKTIELDKNYGDWDVFEIGTYDDSSVLGGQWFKRPIDCGTLEEMKATHPEAVVEKDGRYIPRAIMPSCAPAGFDEADCGERWDDDY